MVFYVSYRGFRYSSVIILQALFILLIINYVVTLYQLSGVYSIVYSFSNYSNHATPISILDVDSIPASFLPQMRPSGIFPAPTYTSFFCIIMYSISTFSYNKMNKFFMVLIGSYFVLTGSTLALVLILLLSVNIFRNKIFIWALLSYAISIIIYFYFFPDIAAYNYSISDFMNSVIYRTMDESIITLNPVLFGIFIILFIMIILYIFSIFKISFSSTIPVFAVVFFPMLLHDATSSLFSFFMLGMGSGMLGLLIQKSKTKYHSDLAPEKRTP